VWPGRTSILKFVMCKCGDQFKVLAKHAAETFRSFGQADYDFCRHHSVTKSQMPTVIKCQQWHSTLLIDKQLMVDFLHSRDARAHAAETFVSTPLIDLCLL
jgi:hypothetical protein